MKDSIQPYINRRVIVLNQDLPAKVAARALHERGVGSAMVADSHGHIVGIVTDRDLSSQVLGFELPSGTPISEIMTTEIIKARRNTTIGDVAKIMEVNGIRRVPIVEKTENGREKCLGIVTLDDLIASQAVDPGLLSRIVRTQIFRQVRGTRSSGNEDRRDQTLNRFNKIMADQMDVPKATAERAAFHILKEIVKRLSSAEAAHFIAQLPSLLHEDLLSLPAGPNPNIDEKTIIVDLMKGFQLDHSEAADLAESFWRGLEEALDPAILGHVLAQMPPGLRRIFGDQTPMVDTIQMEFSYAISK
jgi:CBS domain-containing protein/uncharacterized protein (DUF2267 family)